MQLEDQSFPKRCGHLADKALIPAGEMAGKIAPPSTPAPARRRSSSPAPTRSPSKASSAAIERAARYAEAGADMLFVEAPRTREQLAGIAPALGARAPLMANMVEGGQTPILSGAGTRGARLRARHLPRRDRARARPCRSGFLRRAEARRHHGRVSRPDVRLRRPQHLIGTPQTLERGRATRAGAPGRKNGGRVHDDSIPSPWRC